LNEVAKILPKRPTHEVTKIIPRRPTSPQPGPSGLQQQRQRSRPVNHQCQPPAKKAKDNAQQPPPSSPAKPLQSQKSPTKRRHLHKRQMTDDQPPTKRSKPARPTPWSHNDLFPDFNVTTTYTCLFSNEQKPLHLLRRRHHSAPPEYLLPQVTFHTKKEGNPNSARVEAHIQHHQLLQPENQPSSNRVPLAWFRHSTRNSNKVRYTKDLTLQNKTSLSTLERILNLAPDKIRPVKIKYFLPATKPVPITLHDKNCNSALSQLRRTKQRRIWYNPFRATLTSLAFKPSTWSVPEASAITIKPQDIHQHHQRQYLTKYSDAIMPFHSFLFPQYTTRRPRSIRFKEPHTSPLTRALNLHLAHDANFHYLGFQSRQAANNDCFYAAIRTALLLSTDELFKPSTPAQVLRKFRQLVKRNLANRAFTGLQLDGFNAPIKVVKDQQSMCPCTYTNYNMGSNYVRTPDPLRRKRHPSNSQDHDEYGA